MGLLNGSLHVRVSIPCLVVQVQFLMASYEHFIMMSMKWHLLCGLLGRIVWPPTPTVSCEHSLANVGIYSIVVLIVYWLVGTWGCYGGCVSIGSGSLFSILFLCIIMDIAYYMAMTLISSNVYLMLSLWILNVVSIFSIEGVCGCHSMIAPAVMTISGSTFHVDIIVY